jgi:hypothetical protein
MRTRVPARSDQPEPPPSVRDPIPGSLTDNPQHSQEPEMAETEFTVETSPVTMAELDGDCQAYAFRPGHIEVGAQVPCPDADHEHWVVSVLQTEVAENVRIID